MADEAFDYMIVLDDGETFGYLEGARVLKVPQRLTEPRRPGSESFQELQEYIEENLKYADPLTVVEDDDCTMIIQRID